MMYVNVRKNTCKMLDLIDQGELDARYVAEMALGWVPDADVLAMARANDMIDLFEEEEDEDEDTPACSPV